MLYPSLDTLLKVSKTTSPQNLFVYDCVTLYHIRIIIKDVNSSGFRGGLQQIAPPPAVLKTVGAPDPL